MQGDLAGAVASFKNALAIDPQHVAAHLNLGITLSDQGDLVDAVASYKRALAIDPQHAAGVHFNLGIALCNQGDLAGAVASYTRALTIDPQHVDAHGNLGNALMRQLVVVGCLLCIVIIENGTLTADKLIVLRRFRRCLAAYCLWR